MRTKVFLGIGSFLLGLFSMFLFQSKQVQMTRDYKDHLLKDMAQMSVYNAHIVWLDNSLIPALIECEPPPTAKCNSTATQDKVMQRYADYVKLTGQKHLVEADEKALATEAGKNQFWLVR